MPGRQPSRSELKRQAIADLERARTSLALHGGEASADLSPAAMIERSFKKHRVVWVVGATIAGAVIVRYLLSSPPAKNERDNFGKSGTKGRLFRMLSGPLFAVGRKAAFDYATKYFKNQFQQAHQAPASGRDSL